MTTEETELPQTEVVEVTEEMLASLSAGPRARVVTPIDVVARAMAQIRLSGPLLQPSRTAGLSPASEREGVERERALHLRTPAPVIDEATRAEVDGVDAASGAVPDVDSGGAARASPVCTPAPVVGDESQAEVDGVDAASGALSDIDARGTARSSPVRGEESRTGVEGVEASRGSRARMSVPSKESQAEVDGVDALRGAVSDVDSCGTMGPQSSIDQSRAEVDGARQSGDFDGAVRAERTRTPRPVRPSRSALPMLDRAPRPSRASVALVPWNETLPSPVPTAPDPVPFALQPAPTAPRPFPSAVDPEARRVTLEKPAVETHPTREIARAGNDQLNEEELAALKKDRTLLFAAIGVVAVVFALAAWSFVPSDAPDLQYASRKPTPRAAPRAAEKTPSAAPLVAPAPNPWRLEPAQSSLDTFAVNGGQVLLDPTHRYRVRVVNGAAGLVSARVQTANQPWGPLYPLVGPALRVTGATGLRLHCEPRGTFSPSDVLEVELSDLAMRREQRFTLNVLTQCFDFSGLPSRTVAERVKLFLPVHEQQPKVKVAWQLARPDGSFEAGTLSAGQSAVLEPGQLRLALLSHTLESKEPVTLQPLPPEGDVGGVVANAGPRIDWERRPNVALVPPVVTPAPAPRPKLPEVWPPEPRGELEVER